MANKKFETYIFEGFGFPVVLINAPWRKTLGEWVLDINLNKLKDFVLDYLIHKESPLTGEELKFIRKHLEMTVAAFGKLFGVTHVSILKWENNEVKISPTTEFCIRLYVKDQLHTKDKEFRQFYHDLRIENLAKYKKRVRYKPLEIDTNMLCA